MPKDLDDSQATMTYPEYLAKLKAEPATVKPAQGAVRGKIKKAKRKYFVRKK